MLHSRLCRLWLPLIVATGLGAQNGKPPALAWPIPAGWGHETIPFPLDFAPELKHQGVEELRFMPGFFDPASPNRWSYAFAWQLEDSVPVDADALAQAFTTYFKGLCGSVASGKPFKLDPARYACHLRAIAPARYEGEADLYDCFRTGGPITLRLKLRRSTDGHRLLVLASPHAFTEAPWPALEACADAFPAF